MLADDACCPRDVDARVPRILGIDDDHGPVTTLVHAAGMIDANDALESCRGHTLLEGLVHILGALLRALFARGADEHVVFVLAHEARSNEDEEAQSMSAGTHDHWLAAVDTAIVVPCRSRSTRTTWC